MSEVFKAVIYYDFIPKNKIKQFEEDLEKRNYQKWIDSYPDHKYSIFGAFMYFCGYGVAEEDVSYFKSKGVDLNVSCNVYPSNLEGGTALGSACEFRNLNLVKILIKHGANVNKADQHNFTPLESMLVGHHESDTYNVEECEEGIKLLIAAGAKNNVRADVKKDFCHHYLKNSEYLKKILTETPDRG